MKNHSNLVTTVTEKEAIKWLFTLKPLAFLQSHLKLLYDNNDKSYTRVSQLKKIADATFKIGRMIATLLHRREKAIHSLSRYQL